MIKRPKARADDPYDGEVGQRIRAFRLSRGMSQSELGRRLGLTFQQIQKYEKGVNRVGAGRLQRISEIFDVPIATFFGVPAKNRDPLVAPLELLSHAGAPQLLEAYARIRNRSVQRALVNFAKQVALAGRG
jgi:transcriptional regulator with XRE-family HTH domain